MPLSTLAYSIGENLYLNITDRCTLRCAFCPRHTGRPQVHDYDLALDTRPETADIVAAIGDPAAYRQIEACRRLAAERGVGFRRRTPGVVG